MISVDDAVISHAKSEREYGILYRYTMLRWGICKNYQSRERLKFS